MAEKGNNMPFKSPQMGQPGWIQGDLFFSLSDTIQKCEPCLPRAASLPMCQWEYENHECPECEPFIFSMAKES